MKTEKEKLVLKLEVFLDEYEEMRISLQSHKLMEKALIIDILETAISKVNTNPKNPNKND